MFPDEIKMKKEEATADQQTEFHRCTIVGPLVSQHLQCVCTNISRSYISARYTHVLDVVGKYSQQSTLSYSTDE